MTISAEEAKRKVLEKYPEADYCNSIDQQWEIWVEGGTGVVLGKGETPDAAWLNAYERMNDDI